MDAQLREYQLAQQREEAERKERMKQAKAQESARKKQEAAAYVQFIFAYGSA